MLLNAGAVRRTGPSRWWMEAARRWAAQGIPTLRLDAEGLGDADGDETRYSDGQTLYAPAFVSQVLSALDYMQERGIGDRFILGGLCTGATWSLHAALRDRRVCAVLMLNLQVVIWDSGLTPARDLRASLSQRLALSRFRRVATWRRVGGFLRWMLPASLRWLKTAGVG